MAFIPELRALSGGARNLPPSLLKSAPDHASFADNFSTTAPARCRVLGSESKARSM